MSNSKRPNRYLRITLSMLVSFASSFALAEAVPPVPQIALRANVGSTQASPTGNAQQSRAEKDITSLLRGEWGPPKYDNTSVENRIKGRESNIKQLTEDFNKLQAYSSQLADYEQKLKKTIQEIAADEGNVDKARAAEREARDRARKAAEEAKRQSAQGAPPSPAGAVPAVQETSETEGLKNYKFMSPASPFTDELINIHAELTSVNPRNDREKTSRGFGLRSLVFADRALLEGDIETATAYRDLGLGFLDMALGLTPGVGWAKDAYEALTGYNLVTGDALSPFERGVAVFGVATGGYGSKFVSGIKAVDKAVALLKPMANSALELSTVVARNIANSPLGIAAGRLRLAGVSTDWSAFKFFDRRAHINNPFPKDMVFSKAIERKYAEALKKGTGRMAAEDKVEAFVGAAEDLKGVTKANLAERLWLMQDKAGTIFKDVSDYVIVEFKFKVAHDPILTSPIEIKKKRLYGWIPFGRSKGGAREYLADPDAFNNGMVDLETVVIRELEK